MSDIKVGNKYGYWTVIEIDDGQHSGKVLCRCQCGTVRWLFRSPLRTGKTQSCGCKAHQQKNYGLHPGDKIGNWTILKQNHQRFFCRCICGREKWVYAVNLLQGRSNSCGCCRADNRQQESARALKKRNIIINTLSNNKLTPKYAGFGRKKNINSSTGVTGVSRFSDGRYWAYITVDGKQISLGYFDSINDAIAVRKAAEKRYFADRQKKADEIRKTYGKK